MSVKFALGLNEKIYKEGLVAYMKSTLNVQNCDGYLTSNRFVLCAKPVWLLGIFSFLIKSKNISLQLELPEIKSIGEVKHGFAKKTVIQMSTGETVNVQFVLGRDKWYQSIIEAVQALDANVKVKTIGDLIEFTH